MERIFSHINFSKLIIIIQIIIKEEKNLGEGGFGIIYEANSLKNKEEKFAIKIMEKKKVKDYIKKKLNKIRKITEQDMKPYLDGFLNEVNHMKILQGINNENENTVIFKEYFNTEEEFGIVMELCDSDLSKNEKKLDYKEIQAILKQLNNSFKIMSENKILHRAIKPGNILIKKKMMKLFLN